MSRYDVRAVIPGRGPVKHVVKADNVSAALVKLRRAYPGCQFVDERARYIGPAIPPARVAS